MDQSADRRRIFLCHANEDKPVALQIEQELSDAGVEVWVDHSALQGGGNLAVMISEALERCDTLLLLWSENGRRSGWVKREWTSAVALHKAVIPCRLDGAPLPALLAGEKSLDSLRKDLEQYASALAVIARVNP